MTAQWDSKPTTRHSRESCRSGSLKVMAVIEQGAADWAPETPGACRSEVQDRATQESSE